MRRKFTGVLVLCTHEQIHHSFTNNVFVYLLFIEELSIGVYLPFLMIADQTKGSEVKTDFVPKVCKISKVFLGCDIVVAELFGFLQSCCYQRPGPFHVVNVIWKVLFFELFYLLISHSSLLLPFFLRLLKKKSFDSSGQMVIDQVFFWNFFDPVFFFQNLEVLVADGLKPH